MAEIMKVRHIGLVVNNFELMLAFYTQALGFEVAWSFIIDSEEFRKGVGISDARAKGAHLKISGSDMQIEMIEYEPKLMRVPGLSSSNFPGFRHMAFVVNDINEMFEKLHNLGVEFFSEEPILVTSPPAASGLKFVYLKDPEGNIIELNQLPESWLKK